MHGLDARLPRGPHLWPDGASKPCMITAGRWGTPRPLRGDADVLRLQVLLDALRAALAAEAGVLHAAERGRRVRHDALVQADHAGLQALGHRERPGDVAGVEVRDQAEL